MKKDYLEPHVEIIKFNETEIRTEETSSSVDVPLDDWFS
mgnify:CR=1 FL=1